MQNVCSKQSLIKQGLAKRILAILTIGAIVNIAPLTINTTYFANTKSFAASISDDEKIDMRSFSGAYLAGRVANSENRMDLAIDFFKQALAFDPKNEALHYDLLINFLSIGDFKQAVTQANEIKTNARDERYVFLTLMADAFVKKNYLLAINRLEISNPSELDHLVIEMLKSWANIGRGKNKEAIENIKKLTGPQWYNLFLSFHLALLNDVSGNKQEAEKYYRQALKNLQGGSSAPATYEKIIINFAAFELKNNKRENAIKILRDGEKILSGSTNLQNIRQNVENGGKIDSAVVTAQDGASELLYDIGTAINQAGAEAYARIYLQLSKVLRENNDATLYQLADITAKLNQYDLAIQLYSQIPEKSPFWRDSKLNLALTLAQNNENAKALEKLTSLQQKLPKDKNVTLSLASLYMQDKNFDKAVEIISDSFKQSNTPNTADWFLYFQRGIAYERLKQWDKAEPDFRKSLELNPKASDVLNYLGYSLIDRNEKLEEALNMVKQATELEPSDGLIVDSLGWAYYKLGRYDEALTTLENAIQIRPEDMTINEHLGDVYWQVGRKLEAGYQWNHALVAATEPEDKIRIENKIKNGLTAEQQAKSEK